MPTVEVIQGDMLELLPRWHQDGLRVSTILTDPPYHLSSIQKRFGKPGSAPAKPGKDGAAARLSRGFMGSATDEGDISFQPETWRLCLDLLEPGGRLACFGGTRTFWRMAAAIDAAGFEYEDTIAWVYGQGLVLRRSRLKPAWEPVLLFRKPGPVRDLNIEESRTPEARWPPNLIHDGSQEVIASLPDAPGQIAATRADKTQKSGHVYGDLQYGSASSPPRPDGGSAARFFTECAFSEEEKRLLYCPKAPSRERCYHCTICDRNCLHADRAEHAHGHEDLAHLHAHPTLKPLTLMRHLVRLLVPKDGLVLDPFAGTGTTLLAAKLEGRDAIGIERDPRYAEHCRLRVA